MFEFFRNNGMSLIDWEKMYEETNTKIVYS